MASVFGRVIIVTILLLLLWQYGRYIHANVEEAEVIQTVHADSPAGVHHFQAQAWMTSRKFDRVMARKGDNYEVCENLEQLNAILEQEEIDESNVIKKYKEAQPPLHCGRTRVGGGYFGLGKKHYELWHDCTAEILPAKRRILLYLEELCHEQRNAVHTLLKYVEYVNSGEEKKSRGIVYTGKASHLKSIYQSIAGHALFNVHLSVEVFVNGHTLALCKSVLEHRFPQVKCKSFPDSVKGFSSKFHALLMSSFTEVLFMDADNMIVDDVNKIFDSNEFKATGMVIWPDMWGERCRPIQPSLDNGFVSYQSHVLWSANMGGLTWKLQRNIAQEAETGQLAIDLSRHGGLLHLALKLISDAKFFKRVVNGDKDLFRLAHILTYTPFYFVPHIPGYSVPGSDGSGLRDCLVHFFGDGEGKPMFFHQLKTRNPDAFQYVLRAPSNVRHLASVCADSRIRAPEPTNSKKVSQNVVVSEVAEMSRPSLPPLEVENVEDGARLRELAKSLFTTVDKEWKTIESSLYYSLSMLYVTIRGFF